MAIVLIIIGLIVGATMAGSAMIRASEIRAAISEYTNYVQAITQFRDKYKALPGDFATATTIWGEAHSNATTCKTTQGTIPTYTCNGDGNGAIVTQSSYATTSYEQFRAWQHLVNAGLIEGYYSGVRAAGSSHGALIGTNFPASKFSGAGWQLTTATTYDISTASITGISYSAGDTPPNLILWFGGKTFENSLRMTPVLRSPEAYDLDIKLDDGKPYYGKIISQTQSGMTTSCVTSNEYTQTATDIACALIFKTGL